MLQGRFHFFYALPIIPPSAASHSSSIGGYWRMLSRLWNIGTCFSTIPPRLLTNKGGMVMQWVPSRIHVTFVLHVGTSSDVKEEKNVRWCGFNVHQTYNIMANYYMCLLALLLCLVLHPDIKYRASHNKHLIHNSNSLFDVVEWETQVSWSALLE